MYNVLKNLAKNDEIMSKNQFTGTATQPQRNRNATANYVNLIRTGTVYDTNVYAVTQLHINKMNLNSHNARTIFGEHLCLKYTEVITRFKYASNVCAIAL